VRVDKGCARFKALAILQAVIFPSTQQYVISPPADRGTKSPE
jgi:hypothetical protein